MAHGTRIRGSVAAALGGHQAVQLSGSWRARWPDPATERLAPGAQTPWRGGATPVVTSLSARGVRLLGGWDRATAMGFADFAMLTLPGPQ